MGLIIKSPGTSSMRGLEVRLRRRPQSMSLNISDLIIPPKRDLSIYLDNKNLVGGFLSSLMRRRWIVW